LVGVFDGHGGDATAQLVVTKFPSILVTQLNASNGQFRRLYSINQSYYIFLKHTHRQHCSWSSIGISKDEQLFTR
jgi:serine/threonine protein phosphatase PrpC